MWNDPISKSRSARSRVSDLTWKKWLVGVGKDSAVSKCNPFPFFPWFLGSYGPFGVPRALPISCLQTSLAPIRWDLHQCLVARVALQIGREESWRLVAKWRPTKLLQLLCHLIGVKVLRLSHGMHHICWGVTDSVDRNTMTTFEKAGSQTKSKGFGWTKTPIFTLCLMCCCHGSSISWLSCHGCFVVSAGLSPQEVKLMTILHGKPLF